MLTLEVFLVHGSLNRSEGPTFPRSLAPRFRWLEAGGVRRGLVDGTRLGAPDVGRVLADRPIAGELSGAGDIEDRLASPAIAVRIQVGDARCAAA